MDATTVAWVATLFCVFFPVRIATVFLQENPRLFTVMALFALAWALLLPYYGSAGAQQSELLPAFNGFLMIYIGALLSLQANVEHNRIVPWQIIGLNLLLFVFVPSLLEIKLPSGARIVRLSSTQIELSVGTLLSVIGYVSIVFGINKLCSRRPFWLIVIIVVPYAALELIFTYFDWHNEGMSDVFKYLFAGAKLLFTLVLSSIVAIAGMSEYDRLGGWSYWIIRFFGFPARPAKSPAPRPPPARP